MVRPRRLPAAAAGLHKFPEKFLELGRFLHEPFGMKLHAATKPRSRPLHRLDDPIGRARNHYKTRRDAIHRLVMARIYAVEAVHRPVQPAVFRPLNLMCERIRLPIAVSIEVR